MKKASAALFLRLNDSLVKSNFDSCHLLKSSNENITIEIGEYGTLTNVSEKLLAIKVDWKLNFDDHNSDYVKKLVGNKML